MLTDLFVVTKMFWHLIRYVPDLKLRQTAVVCFRFLTDCVAKMEVKQVLELYPEYSVSVTLFNNVTNMSELKGMLIKGKLEAALVNATMVRRMENSVKYCFSLCCETKQGVA